MNNKTNVHAPLSAVVKVWLQAMVLSVLVIVGITTASAFELGHSRVTSAPGAPLVVQVPITAMSPEEAASLVVKVAPASAWQSSGLTPPVPLDSLTLSIVAGRNEGSRLVQLRSTDSTQATVVDVLLEVSTSAASRMAQASIIVPPPPSVRLATDQITVQRGDTLIGIAEQFPVAGANLYQQLWALYSSNPDAFLRENMNLLKAGAALRIPDADAVRAVDPVFAKAQYLAHVRAFRQGRGASQADEGISGQAAAQTLQTPPEQQQGSVEKASPEPPPPANDQVRLTAAERAGPAEQVDAQADAQAAREKAVAEERERKQALEQNISALQGAIASGTASAGADQATQPASQSASQPGSQQGSQSVTQSAEQASAVTGNSTADQSSVSSDTAQTGAQNKSGSASGQGQSQTKTEGVDTRAEGVGAPADFFSRISQWVSDNTTAAIALLLALVALVLAWALRATKTKPSDVDVAQKRVDHASADFAQKLKDIDLSLDDKPEPTLSKPDSKG